MADNKNKGSKNKRKETQGPLEVNDSAVAVLKKMKTPPRVSIVHETHGSATASSSTPAKASVARASSAKASSFPSTKGFASDKAATSVQEPSVSASALVSPSAPSTAVIPSVGIDGAADTVKSSRLVYDRGPRDDANGMKNTLLYHVYANQYHLKGSKAANFQAVAHELGVARVQGLSKVSAESLQRKYQEIMQDVANSIDNGYLRGIEGPDDDNDNGHSGDEEDDDDDDDDNCSTSDSEVQVQREMHRKSRRVGFDGSSQFERTALLILKDLQKAADMKQLAMTEKITRDNALSAAEEGVLNGIEGTTNSSNSNSTKSKSKPRTSRHDTDMDEFKEMMKTFGPSHPPAAPAAVPTASSVATTDGVDDVTTRMVAKLDAQRIRTVQDLLVAACVSVDGINRLLTCTGLDSERPARKMVVLYLSLDGGLKELQSTCDLKAGDAAELVDFMRGLSQK